MVPYAPAFSISMTAISGSAMGATPFLTSGALALAVLAVFLSPVHERARADTISREIIAIRFIYLYSKCFFAIENYRDRAVVDELDVHHGSKRSRLNL